MLAAIFDGTVVPERIVSDKRALRAIFIKNDDVKRLKSSAILSNKTPEKEILELTRPDFDVWRQRIAELKRADR